MAELDQTFAALAEPTRLAVVHLLKERRRRPAEMAEELSISRPAISRHLRVLRRAGLVEEEILADDARVRLYQLRPERFAAVRTWLEEVEAFWADQLSAFIAHAEKERE